MPTSSFTCRAEDLEMLAIPPGGSWPTTPNTGTGNCPGSGSTPTAAGRLPSEGESYAQSAHSELIPQQGGFSEGSRTRSCSGITRVRSVPPYHARFVPDRPIRPQAAATPEPALAAVQE